jgi:MFS family permease
MTQPPTAAIAPASSTLAAFRSSTFRLYMIGQLVSLSGTWMQRVAQGWLIYEISGSEAWLGASAFASGLPTLLLMPFGGTLADRFPRRRIMQVVYVVELLIAALFALLTFAGTIQIEHIIVLSFGFGVTSAFGEPARQAVINDLVEREALGSGISINGMMFNSAAIIGPAMAGVLLSSVGAAWCFAFNSVSYLVVLVVLQLLTPRPVSITPSPRVSPLRQVMEGWRYILQHRTIDKLILQGTLINVLGINLFITLLPAYASRVLNSPEVGLTALSVAVSVGSVLGGLLTVSAGRRLGRGRLVALMSVCVGIVSVALVNLSDLRAAVIAGILYGFVNTQFFLSSNILIQTQVDDAFRGRVMSTWMLNRFAIGPLTMLLLGALATQIGVVATIGMSGGAIIVLNAVFWAQMRAVRVLR